MEQSLEKKWQQICLHKDHIRSDASYENEAIAWAERLHNEKLGMLSLKEAISLASDVRLAPIVWLEAFYFHNGDEVIFSQLQRLQIAKTRDGNTSSIIGQFVDCLKSLMNLEAGMDAVLDVDNAVQTIVLCLASDFTQNLRLTMNIIRLLSLLTFTIELTRSTLSKVAMTCSRASMFS